MFMKSRERERERESTSAPSTAKIVFIRGTTVLGNMRGGVVECAKLTISFIFLKILQRELLHHPVGRPFLKVCRRDVRFVEVQVLFAWQAIVPYQRLVKRSAEISYEKFI